MADSKKPDELREHNFDGIQEYDNQLPRWWVYMFLFSAIFAVGYFYLFHVEDSKKSLQQEYLDEWKSQASKLKANQPNDMKTPSEEELLVLVKKPEVIEKGRAIFTAKCTSCHGNEGQGIVGPNLTDDYWIHGSKMTDIIRTITYGVAEKGMIAWKDMLSNEETQNVAAFIKS